MEEVRNVPLRDPNIEDKPNDEDKLNKIWVFSVKLH